MSSTLLSWIEPVQSGIVFSESFESDNFLTNEAWTVVQGNPANSSNQYKQGIKSFICSGTGATLAIIKKVITDTNQQNRAICEVWFYDDMTTTAGTGPYLKIKSSGGDFVQVGVRNSVSTTKYVTNAANTFTEDNFAHLLGNRSLGWHKIMIYKDIFSKWNGTVDGTAFQIGAGAGGTFSEISLCSGTTSDTLGTFGFFDSLFLFRDFAAQVQGLTTARTAIAYDSTFTVLNAAASGSDFYYVLGEPNATALFPFTTVIEISQPSTLKTEFISKFIDLYPGDVYKYTSIDFGRVVRTVDPVPTSLANRTQSNAGIQEVLKYALKDKIPFQINKLLGHIWREKGDNWFDYASTGDQFSLLVKSLTEDAFGVISAQVIAGGPDTGTGSPDTITLKTNMSTNPTDEFTVGNFYVIRDAANTRKQKFQLVSKTNTTLTLDGRLRFTVNPLDYCYSLFFFPFLELGENQLNGFKLQDARVPYYDWVQNLQEFNQ